MTIGLAIARPFLFVEAQMDTLRPGRGRVHYRDGAMVFVVANGTNKSRLAVALSCGDTGFVSGRIGRT